MKANGSTNVKIRWLLQEIIHVRQLSFLLDSKGKNMDTEESVTEEDENKVSEEATEEKDEQAENVVS